jgi:hypothetical protein
MAKRARELEVKERRTRKREKKQAAAAARNAELAGETELAGEMLPAPPVDREPAV